MITRIGCTLLLFFSAIGFAWSQSYLLGSPDAIVLDMRLSEDGQLLVASTPSDVQLWNLTTRSQMSNWKVAGIQSLAVSGDRVAGASKSGSLYIWNIGDDGFEKYEITSVPLLCVAWIDPQWIVAGADDGTLFKIEAASGRIVSKSSMNKSITAVSGGRFQTVLAGTISGELALFDAAEWKQTQLLNAHDGSIREIQVIDSAAFVTISSDNHITRWRSSDLVKLPVRLRGSVLIAGDYLSDSSQHSSLFAIGRLNGDIEVQFSFGRYSARANAIVNRVRILESSLPQIQLIVGTHGGGIQVWSAKEMKFKKT